MYTCIFVEILKKKKEKNETAQALGSFIGPTTDTNILVLIHENVDVHMFMNKSVHSYTLPVLIMIRLWYVPG